MGKTCHHSALSLRLWKCSMYRSSSSSSCMWNLITKRNRSLGTCLVTTHVLLHLHQHQSSHRDHLVDGMGAFHDDVICCLLVCSAVTEWTLGSRPHLHISALKRPTPVCTCSLLILTQACCGRSDPGLLLDGEVIHSHSLLVDSCHSTDHILAIQWAFQMY